jgi:hypothetical protein
MHSIQTSLAMSQLYLMLQKSDMDMARYKQNGFLSLRTTSKLCRVMFFQMSIAIKFNNNNALLPVLKTYGRGNSIEISLWGPRAIEFDAETVYANGQESAVIVIFVGTLAKTIKTEKGDKVILTGTSACRWYINEYIPAINEFYAK